MLAMLFKYIRLQLSIDDIIEHKIFNKVPFEREGSKQFFDYVKNDEYHNVEKMLYRNKYHVYDYDTLFETPLHWAAKRGYLQICRFLIRAHADIDTKDILGKSALYYAVREG